MAILNPNSRQLDMTLQFNKIENNKTTSTYKFIDLFAGIGGVRLGFQHIFKEKGCFFNMWMVRN